MTFERPNKLLWIVALVIVGFCTAQTKRKIIIDQDARGPATTDQQSILLLLQSPQVETLGITVVSGDQWRDEEVAHTLRMLELTEHTDVKVYPGAVFPLINSKEEIARWQHLYGRVYYQGAWNDHKVGSYTGSWNLGKYHGPFEVPDLVEGKSHDKTGQGRRRPLHYPYGASVSRRSYDLCRGTSDELGSSYQLRPGDLKAGS